MERVSLHGGNPEPLMSALAHKQTFRSDRLMSALHAAAMTTVPKADVHAKFE